MAQVIVVGAGISGAACARVLVEAGHDVDVLDRGRRPGGRMAILRQDGRPTDIGASYFTVTDPTFRTMVDDWERRGLASPWTDTFSVWSPDGEITKTGPMRWAAPGGLRELVADLASGLMVRQEATAERVSLSNGCLDVDGHAAEAVVLAMPDPQAERLLSPEIAGKVGPLDADFEPVLALTTTWPDHAWTQRDGIFVNDHDVLSWIADDGLRRGDRAPVLVAHSTPGFAGRHLDNPADASPVMVAALRQVVGLANTLEPVSATVHRWTYARPSGSRDRPYLLTDDGIGVCGDGWAAKPSVEAAFLSGHRLGEALAARLGDRG